MYDGTLVTPYVERSSAHFYVGERKSEYELERFANRRARCPEHGLLVLAGRAGPNEDFGERAVGRLDCERV